MLVSQAVLPSPEELAAEAPTAVPRRDDEPVDRPAPAIPCGYHGADDVRSVVDGDKQGLGIMGDEPVNAFDVIGVRRMSIGLAPELENLARISCRCSADLHAHEPIVERKVGRAEGLPRRRRDRGGWVSVRPRVHAASRLQRGF